MSEENLVRTQEAPVSALMRACVYLAEKDPTTATREELEMLLRAFLLARNVGEIELEGDEVEAFDESIRSAMADAAHERRIARARDLMRGRSYGKRTGGEDGAGEDRRRECEGPGQGRGEG